MRPDEGQTRYSVHRLLMCRDDRRLRDVESASANLVGTRNSLPNSLYLRDLPCTLRAGDKTSLGIVNSLAYATGLLFLTTRCCSASYKNLFK
jgi:hypothetical protein